MEPTAQHADRQNAIRNGVAFGWAFVCNWWKYRLPGANCHCRDDRVRRRPFDRTVDLCGATSKSTPMPRYSGHWQKSGCSRRNRRTCSHDVHPTHSWQLHRPMDRDASSSKAHGTSRTDARRRTPHKHMWEHCVIKIISLKRKWLAVAAVIASGEYVQYKCYCSRSKHWFQEPSNLKMWKMLLWFLSARTR